MDFLQAIPFYILSLVAVVCALGMIFIPNLVRAGFTLIGSFTAIAGIYFMLYANFVAVSQVLIYAVGIVLVIVFALMLCSLKENASNMTDHEAGSGILGKISAGALSFLVFLALAFIANTQDWSVIAKLTGAATHGALIEQISDQYTSQIGFLMLNKYVLPFELISILLLMVLVGVIILSKKNLENK
jgi:NADH:ubiquinone oxidoreductase subunit 6 (subunit J)